MRQPVVACAARRTSEKRRAGHHRVAERLMLDTARLRADCPMLARVEHGDRVVVTAMDHHSNIVPWQILCQEKNATLRMVEITEDGRIDLSDFGRALESRPKIVAFPYVSNSLGTVNPVAQLTKLAHAAGAVAVVDGAQAAPHLRVDVQAIDCDFFPLSGH